MAGNRIRNAQLHSKIMTAKQAAALIPTGCNVGMSGFTGAGYPKAVPLALAERINAAARRGREVQDRRWTGASTAPELDGALAKVDGIEMRLPYQSDPTCRKRINAGEMEYIDIHLSHVGQFVWFGFLGKLDVAVVEVAGIREDGALIPSSSVGNNKTWLDQRRQDHPRGQLLAERSAGGHARHLLRHATAAAPHADPADHRRATASARPTCAAIPSKIIAIVETNSPDRNSAVLAARRKFAADRRAHPRVPRPRGEEGPAARRTCCRCSRASAMSPTP